MVLGDNEQTSREAWADNHLGDRASLDLIGQQEELARADLRARQADGRGAAQRPAACRSTISPSNAPALIEGWYLGQETGHAVADVLFGRVNPGGKLPVSIARNVGQLPVFYNRKPTARRGYLFDSDQPLYPFGFGLSYTTLRHLGAAAVARRRSAPATMSGSRSTSPTPARAPATRSSSSTSATMPPRSPGRCSS